MAEGDEGKEEVPKDGRERRGGWVVNEGVYGREREEDI